MAIEKLDIPGGMPVLRIARKPQLVIDGLIAERAEDFDVLSPGIYDLIPTSEDIYPTAGLELTVLNNGEGLVRKINSNSDRIENMQNELRLGYSLGQILITGHLKEQDKVLRLFSIIHWKE